MSSYLKRIGLTSMASMAQVEVVIRTSFPLFMHAAKAVLEKSAV
jgi:hypothetical protein